MDGMIPKVSIYVVSYERDYPWLEFLFRSIAKHCTGFLELIIAVPETDIGALEKMFPVTRKLGIPFPVHTVVFDDSEYADKHMAAMEARLNADLCIGGDACLNVDSDCCFLKKTTPELFFDQNKHVINLFSPFTTINGKVWPTHWGASTERALGEYVPNECMRRHPNLYYRETYSRLREHIKKVHGKTWDEYLKPLKRGGFSEFCCLGAYAMAHEGAYRWIDAESPERSNSDCLWQFWSFSGTSDPSVQAKLKELELLLFL